MTDTTDEAGRGPEGLPELRQAFEELIFLKVVDQLRRQFYNATREEAQDAVSNATVALVAQLKKKPVDDVRGYLYVSAANALRKTVTRRRTVPLEERDDVEVESFEDEVVRRAFLDWMRAQVRTWDSRNMKAVVLTYLDMYAAGELLTGAQITAIVNADLGEDLTEANVRQLKRRGFQKLRDVLVDHDDTTEYRRAVGGEG